jgi:hypothetical protein
MPRLLQLLPEVNTTRKGITLTPLQQTIPWLQLPAGMPLETLPRHASCCSAAAGALQAPCRRLAAHSNSVHTSGGWQVRRWRGQSSSMQARLQ